MPEAATEIASLPDRSLLVVDDDAPLRTRLGRALESRGFATRLAGSVNEAVDMIRAEAPAFAVLDMRLEDGNGLKVVEAVRERRADARIVMLTGDNPRTGQAIAGQLGLGVKAGLLPEDKLREIAALKVFSSEPSQRLQVPFTIVPGATA